MNSRLPLSLVRTSKPTAGAEAAVREHHDDLGAPCTDRADWCAVVFLLASPLRIALKQLGRSSKQRWDVGSFDPSSGPRRLACARAARVSLRWEGINAVQPDRVALTS